LRRFVGEPAIGVGAERHVRSERFPHGLRRGNLGSERLDADLELEEADAGGLARLGLGNVLLRRRIADEPHRRNRLPDRPTTDEVDHRHPGGARGKIEERHLHRGMRAGVAVKHRAHALEERGAQPRIRVDQHGAKIFAHRGDEAGDGVAGHGRRRCRFAPADGSVPRLNAHQEVARMGDRLSRHLHRLDERQRHRNRIDPLDRERGASESGSMFGGDLHAGPRDARDL
jgi:hypothetical protein